MPDRENVTVRAKSADYARSDSRNERMTTEFFSLVDIRNMHLENRKRARVEGIQHGD